MSRRTSFIAFALTFIIAACRPASNASPWVRGSKPAFTGFYGSFSADASVIKLKNGYRMYYTEFDPNGEGAEDDGSGICLAQSNDGNTWSVVGAEDRDTPPFVLEGVPGSGEEDLETCFCIFAENRYYLYYSGYPRAGIEVYEDSEIIETMGSSIYLAVSDDGLAFRRVGPVLKSDPGWYDEDALFSPSVIRSETGFFMVYAGHRYDPEGDSGVYVLGAVSEDGIAWKKLSSPLLSPGSVLPNEDPAHAYAWMRSGAAEPDILACPDGRFSLYFTGIDDAAGTRSIGVAVADAPEGPYRIEPEPILKASHFGFDAGAVLAPDVLIDGDRLRLWYNGLGRNESSWLLGYAEAPLPR